MSGVTVLIVTGPYAGTTAQEAGFQRDGDDPMTVLESVNRHRYEWKLTWPPDCDPMELEAWGQADMMTRLIRALYDGRGIRFMGHRWQNRAGDKEDGWRVFAELTIAMNNVDKPLMVLSDDPGGGDLVIGIGPEDTLP